MKHTGCTQRLALFAIMGLLSSCRGMSLNDPIPPPATPPLWIHSSEEIASDQRTLTLSFQFVPDPDPDGGSNTEDERIDITKAGYLKLEWAQLGDEARTPVVVFQTPCTPGTEACEYVESLNQQLQDGRRTLRLNIPLSGLRPGYPIVRFWLSASLYFTYDEDKPYVVKKSFSGEPY